MRGMHGETPCPLTPSTRRRVGDWVIFRPVILPGAKYLTLKKN